MACSLVHEGEANLSLSRIQVMQNTLKDWPDDIKIAQCRQCSSPACVDACPTGALRIDTANGNIRVVDESECIGCELCIEACSFIPKRILMNSTTGKALKCDLCLNTPFRKEKGGPGGKQACVDVCPQQCIKFVTETPGQQGDQAYDFRFNS